MTKTKKKSSTKKAQPKKEAKTAIQKEAPKPVKIEKKKAEVREAPKPVKKKRLAYYYAVGRRKSAVARVSLLKNGEGKIEINSKDIKDFFPWLPFQTLIEGPLLAVGQKNKLNVICLVKGGGTRGQAEAIRLGVARALLELNPIFRRALKKHNYLTRDPRVKERKKYGLKRARRAPQWQKR